MAALKADIDISDAGEGILNPAQQQAFIEAMEVNTTLLPIVRSVGMTEATQNIDIVQFYGRITHAGANADGSVRVLGGSDKVKPTFGNNKLIAKELQAVTGIYDRTLRRIIGKESFGTMLLQMLGKAAGRDFEEFAIFGDTDITYVNDDVLHQTDGWAKKAGNKLYGSGASKDFDPADDMYPYNLFDAMIEALPSKYFDPTELNFMIAKEEFLKALDIMGARNTPLGDAAIVSGKLPAYKGIQPIYVPLFERSNSTANNRAGRIAMLGNPVNMVDGIFHEVTIEPKRIPEARATEWYLTYEGDVHYQEVNGAVTSFIEKAEA